MGRTSDYTKQVRNEEYENSVETTKKSAKSFADIKRMFAKEPMTAEQFGIYLGGCKAAGDFISDKTIKRYIEKLCKMSDGKITASKFMKTVDGTEVYIIQPEIQELLVAMFDTDFFGAKGKPKAGIDVKQRLRAQLAENVEIYLDESVKKQVKSAPQFLNARLEDILTEKIKRARSISFLTNALHPKRSKSVIYIFTLINMYIIAKIYKLIRQNMEIKKEHLCESALFIFILRLISFYRIYAV